MAARQLGRTPVLMYHGILSGGDGSRDKYGVTVANFQKQLARLQTLGFRVIALSELRDTKLCGPSAVITFDDGLSSDYLNAFPALGACGMTAHFFVNTANVDRPGFMTWKQIREMDRAGMEIGSHGHQHVDHSQPSEERLTAELSLSQRILSEELGHAIDWFAPPYGFVNQKTIRAARAAGFSGVATSRIATAKAGCAVVPRVAIESTTTAQEFEAILAGDTSLYLKRNLRALGLYLPKQLLLRFKPSALGVSVLQEQA